MYTGFQNAVAATLVSSNKKINTIAPRHGSVNELKQQIKIPPCKYVEGITNSWEAEPNKYDAPVLYVPEKCLPQHQQREDVFEKGNSY